MAWTDSTIRQVFPGLTFGQWAGQLRPIEAWWRTRFGRSAAARAEHPLAADLARALSLRGLIVDATLLPAPEILENVWRKIAPCLQQPAFHECAHSILAESCSAAREFDPPAFNCPLPRQNCDLLELQAGLSLYQFLLPHLYVLVGVAQAMAHPVRPPGSRPGRPADGWADPRAINCFFRKVRGFIQTEISVPARRWDCYLDGALDVLELQSQRPAYQRAAWRLRALASAAGRQLRPAEGEPDLSWAALREPLARLDELFPALILNLGQLCLFCSPADSLAEPVSPGADLANRQQLAARLRGKPELPTLAGRLPVSWKNAP